MKNYIGISRDHSGSMRSIANAARIDYNQTIEGIKAAARREVVDTIVSTVRCGDGRNATVAREVVNSTIHMLEPLKSYPADAGGTPLFDSVGELIEMLEQVPDANHPDVSFVVMAITDGEENASRKWSSISLKKKISELQVTDRWTFLFRVPRGHARRLASQFSIPEGNILEWDQTNRGVETATTTTVNAFDQFYAARKSGVTSTKTFYTDLSKVSKEEVKKSLIDISSQVVRIEVSHSDNGKEIRKFVEQNMSTYVKGTAFYQLMKPEKEVQDYKKIVIRDKTTKRFYGGQNARHLLGLPDSGTVKVAPGDHGSYDIFIQSTSVNRKLVAGTQVLIWSAA